MNRIYESWSPDRSYVVMTRSRDVTLVLDAFQQAINGGSIDAQELYARRLNGQVNDRVTANDEISFSTSETPLVINTLAAFARELLKLSHRRRHAATLIGLTAVTARHEFVV